jgi:cellulose 1,4-beta-cellobiosidase
MRVRSPSLYISQIHEEYVTWRLHSLTGWFVGHAGWLGWSANIGPAANLFGNVYKNASSPASLRGLATNVANYNAWTISPCPSYTSGDANCDEQLYVNALAPLLANQGWSAHFITDTGKSFLFL